MVSSTHWISYVNVRVFLLWFLCCSMLLWNVPVQAYASAQDQSQHSSTTDQPLEQKSEAESWEIKVDESEACVPQFCGIARQTVSTVSFNVPLDVGTHLMQQVLRGPDSVRGPPRH